MTSPIVVGEHPKRIDLIVYAGVDFTAPVLDAADLPVSSLVGWTVAAQIRPAPDGPLLGVFTVTIDDVSVHVTATAATTAAWAFTAARWDIVLTNPVGEPQPPLCAGWVRRYPTITRQEV
jgi:hypothetical protein